VGFNFRSVLPVAVIVVAGAAADLGTKAWAQSRLSGGRDITLGGGLLRLQLVINHGAAFGLGAGLEPLLATLSLVIVVLVGGPGRLAYPAGGGRPGRGRRGR
jgi:lipoprotein signal peptidase